MARSRMLALALLPLLVAGATACGGGGDGAGAERTAAADTEILTRAFGPGVATAEGNTAAEVFPSCGAWVDASVPVRDALLEVMAFYLGAEGEEVAVPELQEVLDRHCAGRPEASVAEPVTALLLERLPAPRREEAAP